MKQFTCLLITFLAFSVGAFAQSTESFDIATFTSPPGWTKQTKEGAVVFTIANEEKGTFGILTVYRSGASSGSAKADFEADWQEFIAGQLGVTDKPQIEPAKKADGWELVGGGAPFKSGMGGAAVMLNTFSGYGRSFSFAVIFNDQGVLPAVEAFFSSIKLKTPERIAQPAPANDKNSTGILGTWLTSASWNQKYDDYKNAHAINYYGYISRQYTFNPNGTYGFVSKTYQMRLDRLLLVRETGTYQINGDSITLSPQKSVIQAWSRKDGGDKWGKLLTTQSRPLEKVTYRFTRHYFEGIQTWNLVFQSDKTTERDGPFSTNATFKKAWYYAPISPNNVAIELPN